MEKFLIVNADDFGASEGINRGIVECHRRGIVTSTSLMVTGRAVREAVAMSRDCQKLAIGLHWDVWGEDERAFDLSNADAVREEFQRQLDLFQTLLGRLPTHIDSHQHAHRNEVVRDVFQDLVRPLRIPLRATGNIEFVGGFYAQWEWKVTNLEYVGTPFLEKLLREEVLEGWTELSCHPGYVTPDFSSVYQSEREEEIRTLTDPRVRRAIDELHIHLVSFSDAQHAWRGRG
jgi:predicted glycoside hydrolase/deacetylase ChbG (UPF0249 family)